MTELRITAVFLAVLAILAYPVAAQELEPETGEQEPVSVYQDNSSILAELVQSKDRARELSSELDDSRETIEQLRDELEQSQQETSQAREELEQLQERVVILERVQESPMLDAEEPQEQETETQEPDQEPQEIEPEEEPGEPTEAQTEVPTEAPTEIPVTTYEQLHEMLSVLHTDFILLIVSVWAFIAFGFGYAIATGVLKWP